MKDKALSRREILKEIIDWAEMASKNSHDCYSGGYCMSCRVSVRLFGDVYPT